jgi:predicted metal-binding membrane protein
MCVLFAVGVMNLLWVAALTVVVLVEKVGPWGRAVAHIAGAAMIVWGVVHLVLDHHIDYRPSLRSDAIIQMPH